MPPTPTTTKSTSASESAARARANPLSPVDTLRLPDFSLELQRLRHRIEHPGLVASGAIPGGVRYSPRNLRQRLSHACCSFECDAERIARMAALEIGGRGSAKISPAVIFWR